MLCLQKQPVLEGSRGEGTEGAEQVEREPAADVTSAPADAAEPVPMVTDTELEPSPGEQSQNVYNINVCCCKPAL